MRVAHIIGTFHVGGLERLVLDLAVRSREHGVESVVFAFMEDGLYRACFDDAGVPTRFFDTDPGFKPELALRLCAAIREFGADLVHAHHFAPLIYGGLAAGLARRRLVYTEHSREAYDRPRRRAAARAIGRFASVVSVSRELDEWRRREFGQTTTVILNGVGVPDDVGPEAKAAARASLGLDAAAFVVGIVARFMVEKDHATLIRAFAGVRDALPNAQLILVGSGPTVSEIVALVDSLGLNENVRFLGRRFDVQAILPAFDVVALSSVREGLPLALLEGMAHAKAVVATDVGEIRSAAGDCGQVVPAGRPDALRDGILLYARDTERRLQDGAAARARVIARYSSAAMVDRYVDLYRTVLDA